MKSVEEARAAMLAGVASLPRTAVALDDAYGRTLAEDIVARGAQPPFDASAMDGWAVREGDAPGALRIVGESAAGAPYAGTLGAGEAVRIFTGAEVPAGADLVVIQEEARREGDVVHIAAAGARNIRKRGEDFSVGDKLLARGAKLDGVAIALAAAAGVHPIRVTGQPRIAILATGNELVWPGEPLGAGQIFESVSFGIAGLVRGWGGVPLRLPASNDTLEQIAATMEVARKESDLIITIGGASVGDHDLVKPAAKSIGAELLIENVAMRPGKPVWFAKLGGVPLLGLPGNPASALVCAHLFLRPLFDRWAGRAGDVAFLRARLAGTLAANGPREHYVRARLTFDEEGRLSAAPFESQDSARLTVFQNADALIRIPPRAPEMAAGALVDVLRLDRL